MIHYARQMERVGRQPGFLVERLQVANFPRAAVVTGAFRLALEGERYQLSKVDIILDQVIQDFDPPVMHPEPKGHEQIELKAADPLVIPLQRIYRLYRRLFIADENLPQCL